MYMVQAPWDNSTAIAQRSHRRRTLEVRTEFFSGRLEQRRRMARFWHFRTWRAAWRESGIRMRGATPDGGWSHTEDSVGGPGRRPRQRSGFGEETPPKPLGKSAQPRSGGPDVAVTQIRGLLGGELILALQGGQPVLGEGRHPDIVGGLEIDPVHAGRVAAEDHLLDRAVGATERSKTIFLLHILGDFEPTQRLDLPLGRPVPNRVGAPQHMIDPHALDQRADQRGAEFRMRHGRIGKRRAKLRVDVSDAELLWNFR